MKRVVMTHPDVDVPRSFTAKNAEWLKGRDARWKEVPSVLERLKQTKSDANDNTGTETTAGEAEKPKGNRGRSKKGGTNQVSQPG